MWGGNNGVSNTLVGLNTCNPLLLRYLHLKGGILFTPGGENSKEKNTNKRKCKRLTVHSADASIVLKKTEILTGGFTRIYTPFPRREKFFFFVV